MKILVFSDSHKTIGNMYDAVEAERPDRVFHLGDHMRDAEDLACALDHLDILYVPGNCDYANHASPNVLIELGGVRIFLTHGHLFGVKSGLSRLQMEARRLGADLALFGHTHKAHLDEQDGLTLLNPGSCGSGTSHPTYAVIQLENKRFSCEIRDFD